MKRFLLLLLILPLTYNINAQCILTASPIIATVDCGDSVSISLQGYAEAVLTETFTGSGPSDPGWASTVGAIYTNPYIPSPTNDTYFWMGATNVIGQSLTSQGFDVINGGQVCFDFVYAIQGQPSPTEGPDESDEGITFQYSIDGGVTWIDIVYFMPNGEELPSNPGNAFPMTNPPFNNAGTPYTTWNSVCFPIPAGAITNNTSFQWIQEEQSSGADFDHWGLDNIEILLNDPLFGYFHDGFNFISTTPTDVFAYPTQDSTYTFIFSNFQDDTCSTTVDVLVNPITIYGGDTVICLGDTVVLLAESSADANAVYTWDASSTLTTLDGPITSAFPSTSTTYSVELEDGLCISSTSYDVNITPISITAPDNIVICNPGDSAQLSYMVNNAPPEGPCIEEYTLAQVPYYLETQNNPILLTFDSNDDGETGPIPFPFQFDFFCQTVDNIIVTSNGYINMIDNGTLNDELGNDVIPDPTGPQAIIAFMWDDMFNDPATSSYFVTGTAPNRRFVVDFTLRHFGGTVATEPAIGQVIFHETTNIIDISCENCTQDANDGSATQGIENYDGTYGVPVPGRNNSAWSAMNETWRFTPSNNSMIFTPLWSPNSFINDVAIDSPMVAPLLTTDYLIEVYSPDLNCSFYDTTEVVVGFEIEISPDVAICEGDSTQLEVSFADEYIWFPNNGSISNSLIQNPIVYPTTTTLYIVTVDSASCITTDSVTVTVNPNPATLINGGDLVASACGGDDVALISNADPSWDINWTGPEVGTGTSLTVTTPGTYILSTETAFNCTSESVIDVTFNTPIEINTDSIRNVLCCNDNVDIDFNDLVINGVPIQDVYWDGNTVVSSGNESVSSFEDGLYYMTVVDINGCEATAEVFFTTSCNEPKLEGPDSLIVGESYDYAVSSLPSSTSYTWTPSSAFNGTTFTADGSLVEDFQEITTEISADFVLNSGADFTCIERDTTQVFIKQINEPFFPDAFTPNGDGLNDIFFPIYLDSNSSITTFHVYNRWGEKVYDYENGSNGWDGKFLDEIQPSDVYNYYIVVDKNIESYIISGTLTLIR